MGKAQQAAVDKTPQMDEAECPVAYRSLGLVRGKHRIKMVVVHVDALRWVFGWRYHLTIFHDMDCLR